MLFYNISDIFYEIQKLLSFIVHTVVRIWAECWNYACAMFM